MKDKRNCGGMYPIYPQPMPNQMPMMPYQQMPYYNYTQTTTNSNEISNMQNQINNLENRVSKLEQMANSMGSTNSLGSINNSKYTDSNYYMV